MLQKQQLMATPTHLSKLLSGFLLKAPYWLRGWAWLLEAIRLISHDKRAVIITRQKKKTKTNSWEVKGKLWLLWKSTWCLSRHHPDDRPTVLCCRHHADERETVDVSFGSLNSITLTNKSRRVPPFFYYAHDPGTVCKSRKMSIEPHKARSTIVLDLRSSYDLNLLTDERISSLEEVASFCTDNH